MSLLRKIFYPHGMPEDHVPPAMLNPELEREHRAAAAKLVDQSMRVQGVAYDIRREVAEQQKTRD